MTGTLYIVATPIGNLEDITFRAIRILKEVDLIACEDTRTTKKLLFHFGIEKPVASYHDHNEEKKSEELVLALESGKSIALVSDAGTPGISDPGYRIASLASKRGIAVIPIPGASAATSALSVSGLPTSSFAFFGFLPKQAKKQREFLESIRDYPHSLIFYESPHRVLQTLESMLQAFGDRQISASRELTKMFEETVRGEISAVMKMLAERKELRGEFTLVVEGRGQEPPPSDGEIEARLTSLKKKGFTLKDAVRAVSEGMKVSKGKVYGEALKIWADGD